VSRKKGEQTSTRPVGFAVGLNPPRVSVHFGLDVTLSLQNGHTTFADTAYE
jgi:hypothetical protein